MVDKTEAKIDTDINMLFRKVESLEKWRWIVIGVVTALTFFIVHIVPKFLDN